MTNIKISSKMHLFIALSAVLVAIGIAVGIVCQFLAGGYFNYGAEYASYRTIEVNYAYVDFNDENKVDELCDGVFDKIGLKYFEALSGETTEGGRIIYKFSSGVESAKLTQAAEGIMTALKGGEDSVQSNASVHELKTELNGKKVLIFASIAVGSAIVLQFLYYLVRYRVTMAFAALLANIHNLAVYVSLLAITRVPVGISAVALGGLTIIMTMIACAFFFDRYRRNLKKELFTKLDGDAQTDTCVNESLVNILVPASAIAVAALVIFAMLSVSALSVLSIATPAVACVASAASVVYGSAFFIPSVYTRIKRIGDNAKASANAK